MKVRNSMLFQCDQKVVSSIETSKQTAPVMFQPRLENQLQSRLPRTKKMFNLLDERQNKEYFCRRVA